MMKALLRTGLGIGTFFVAGYLARRYFGSSSMGQSVGGSLPGQSFEPNSSASEDLKVPLKDVADRQAI